MKQLMLPKRLIRTGMILISLKRQSHRSKFDSMRLRLFCEVFEIMASSFLIVVLQYIITHTLLLRDA
jgi:hypothetical protein